MPTSREEKLFRTRVGVPILSLLLFLCSSHPCSGLKSRPSPTLLTRQTKEHRNFPANALAVFNSPFNTRLFPSARLIKFVRQLTLLISTAITVSVLILNCSSLEMHLLFLHKPGHEHQIGRHQKLVIFQK